MLPYPDTDDPLVLGYFFSAHPEMVQGDAVQQILFRADLAQKLLDLMESSPYESVRSQAMALASQILPPWLSAVARMMVAAANKPASASSEAKAG